VTFQLGNSGIAMSQFEDNSIIHRTYGTCLAAWHRTFRPPRADANQHLVPRQIEFWVLLLLVGSTIAWLFILHDAELVRWKRLVLKRDSPVVELFEWITLSGSSGWILVITALTGLFLSTSNWSQLSRSVRVQRTNLYGDVNFIFFTVAISGISANLIKNTIGRARPRLLEELGPHYFNHAAFDSKFASFPSGHSTTSGALFMALILLFPRHWPIWLIFGLAGGASRYVIGAHYPSDVLAGLSFGALFVIFAARWLAQRGTLFKLDQGWLPRRKYRRA